MDELIKRFRVAQTKDVLQGLSFCRHPFYCSIKVKYLECWGRLLPEEDSGGFEKFSREMVVSLLNYGFDVVSKRVTQREFTCGDIYLGPLDFVVVESIHRQIFMVAKYDRFIVIFMKNQVTLK